MGTSPGRFSFGRFELDLSTGRVRGPSGPIPLTPKALAVLEHLAARPGRLVGKDELLEAVWPGVFLGDGALKACVSEIRRALGDDPRHPQIIETAHRRGYRFIAEIVGFSSPPGVAPATTERPPVAVRYARNGEVNIAYQVLGSGPIDLVFVMGWVSHLEWFWKEPSFARFLHRLAGFSRLIVFDKRGTGLSDRTTDLPTLEQRMEDVRAVLNAAESRRAVLLGVSEGGPMCSLFAATYPQQTEALIMIGTYARRLRAPDYPWAPTHDERETFCREILHRWGGPVGLEARAPSVAADPGFREWWASYLRMGASPAAAVALTRMNAHIDVRHVLPTIRVPTLVLHRTGDRCLLVEEGRYVAGLIPGARFVELPGDDHLPFVGDQDAILDEVERFLSGARARTESSQVLATILCATLHAGSTSVPDVARLHELVAAQARRFAGRGLQLAGGLAFCAFAGPARAIRCGRAIVEEAAALALPLGIGLHTGECAPLPHAGEGPVAEAAARIARRAPAGEVLVSRTVVDLVAGSGLEFSARGRDALADGEKPRPLFAVR
jgi:pimeloyl-ACP methyl ester carboxylesterase/DNA-binding winged helix-turn-helix (wHTH) protein